MMKKLWHDLYYGLLKERGEVLGLTCQQATLEEQRFKNSRSLSNRLRYLLHMSLCNGCCQYARFSEKLRSQLKKKKVVFTDKQIAELNQKTHEKFKKTQSR